MARSVPSVPHCGNQPTMFLNGVCVGREKRAFSAVSRICAARSPVGSSFTVPTIGFGTMAAEAPAPPSFRYSGLVHSTAVLEAVEVGHRCGLDLALRQGANKFLKHGKGESRQTGTCFLSGMRATSR